MNRPAIPRGRRLLAAVFLLACTACGLNQTPSVGSAGIADSAASAASAAGRPANGAVKY